MEILLGILIMMSTLDLQELLLWLKELLGIL